jgi:hypothetical protein
MRWTLPVFLCDIQVPKDCHLLDIQCKLNAEVLVAA